MNLANGLFVQATQLEVGDFATPETASFRMTLPGPTWPLDSHPDNVRKFVAKHMHAPKQADAAVVTPTPPAPPAATPAVETAEKPSAEPAAKKKNPFENMPREELEKVLREMGWCKASVPATPAAVAESSLAATLEPVESVPGPTSGAMGSTANDPSKSADSKSVALGLTANADASKLAPSASTPRETCPDGLKSMALQNALVHAPVVPVASPLRIAGGTPLQGQSQKAMDTRATGSAEPGVAAATPAAAPASVQAPTGVKPEEQDQKCDQRQCYSRRAAANLIQRLRENPKRVEGLPSLHSMVHDESKKSELITILCENNGSLEAVGAYLQAFEETWRGEFHKKTALRWTKKEMEDHYGADAEKVMNFKRQQGLIEDDENCPGTEVFLMSKKEDEVENGFRGGDLAFHISTWRRLKSLEYIAKVAFVRITRINHILYGRVPD